MRTAAALVLLLLTMLPLAAEPESVALLEQAIAAMQQDGLPEGSAWHLRMKTVEELHPDVELTAEVEIWWNAGGYLELQRYREHLIHAKLWDGAQLYFAESRRIRYPLVIDQKEFQLSWEAMQVASLAPLRRDDAFTLSLGETRRIDDFSCRELIAQSRQSGIVYRLFLDQRAHLLRALAYPTQVLYGGSIHDHDHEVRFENYRKDASGMPIARLIRHLEDGEQKLAATVRTVDLQADIPVDFFTRERLEAILEEHPPFPSQLNRAQRKLLRDTVDAIEKGNAEHAAMRHSAVTRLLDPAKYRAALLDQPTYVMVAPNRLGGHSSAHFMPMDLDEQGRPRLDVITLRDQPLEGFTDFLTLLHEASHLLIRQYQTAAPILAIDDEDLVAWQEESTYLLKNLTDFEAVAFADPRPDNWEQEVQRLWGHVLLRYRYGMAEHALTDAELAQMEAITGFRVRLDEVRQIYLQAGLPEAVIPMQLADRFNKVVDRIEKRQNQLRRPWR